MNTIKLLASETEYFQNFVNKENSLFDFLCRSSLNKLFLCLPCVSKVWPIITWKWLSQINALIVRRNIIGSGIIGQKRHYSRRGLKIRALQPFPLNFRALSSGRDKKIILLKFVGKSIKAPSRIRTCSTMSFSVVFLTFCQQENW